MLKKIFITTIFTFFLSACPQQQNKQITTTPLQINTVNGKIHFNVEVARTPEELQTGLMYRKELALTNGMIFDINPVRPVSMWMKNTELSLDMIFVAPNNKISMIKEHTRPMSEDLIVSREPVRAVIEVPAGNVMRYNIKVGDIVEHDILNNMVSLDDNQITTPTLSKGPNSLPKGPNALPKGPNALPKGPNALPKGPNALPKGPNALPKGPNANIDNQNANVIIPEKPVLEPKTDALAEAKLAEQKKELEEENYLKEISTINLKSQSDPTPVPML